MQILKLIKKGKLEKNVNALFTFKLVARVDPGVDKRKYNIQTYVMATGLNDAEQLFNEMIKRDNYFRRYKVTVQQVILDVVEVIKKEDKNNGKLQESSEREEVIEQNGHES